MCVFHITQKMLNTLPTLPLVTLLKGAIRTRPRAGVVEQGGLQILHPRAGRGPSASAFDSSFLLTGFLGGRQRDGSVPRAPPPRWKSMMDSWLLWGLGQ